MLCSGLLHSLVSCHPLTCPLLPPTHPPMQSMGYQMSTRPRPKPAAKPAAPAAPAPAQLPVRAASAPAAAVAQPEAFQDVVEASAVIEPQSTKQLLTGTELEAAPERRGRPVPVIKAGMAAPSAGMAPPAAPPAPAVAPRPVAVVKPRQRSTIGDMLRGPRDGGNGVNGGSSSGGGGYSYAQPAPMQPAPVQQQPASYPSSPPAGGYPVNTGSRAAAAAAQAAPLEPIAAAVPVQYNADGSVVLASKPIKVGAGRQVAEWEGDFRGFS